MKRNKNRFLSISFTSSFFLFIAFTSGEYALQIHKTLEEKNSFVLSYGQDKHAPLQEALERKERDVSEYKSIQKIVVPGNVRWTETKLNVEKGQEVYFQASGNISLQKGNPMASCGPEGLNLKTMQQPILDQNFGALICKVLIEVTFTVDKETHEKTQHERGEIFFIGAEKKVFMPASGSLWLGINENVVSDNDREFIVTIYLK